MRGRGIAIVLVAVVALAWAGSLAGDAAKAPTDPADELREHIKQLQAEVAQLRQESAQLQRESAELRRDSAQLRAEIAQLRSKVGVLERRADAPLQLPVPESNESIVIPGPSDGGIEAYGRTFRIVPLGPGSAAR